MGYRVTSSTSGLSVYARGHLPYGFEPIRLCCEILLWHVCFGADHRTVEWLCLLAEFLSISGSLCEAESKAEPASEISAPTSASLPTALGSGGRVQEKKASAQV